MGAARDELTAIAWNIIDSAAIDSGPPSGYQISKRPANYAELGRMLRDGADWDTAWSTFLHEFYRYKSAGFFALPPPEWMGPGRKALLAGAAEFLSREFDLTPPSWIESPHYFLEDMWDPLEESIHPLMPQLRAKRMDHTDPAFLRRNVIYETKNLIGQ